MGRGKTKRIIIGDTLYRTFSIEEVEAVFAHELGHQVHNDLWKEILFSSALMYVSFFLADLLMGIFGPDGIKIAIHHPSVLFVFFITLFIIHLPLGLLQVLFSRYCESQADRFADEITGTGQKLADALERLTIQNRGEFCPWPILEFFTYSHPAPWKRILALR